MKIGINASFARKPGSGIGEVTLNYIRALSEKNTDTEFVMYLEEDLSLSLPDNFKQNIFLPWYYRRDDLVRKIIWEKFILPQKIKKDKCIEFISLYQCPTILDENVKHTMIVHDIIPELFPIYLNNWRKKIYWKLTKEAIRKADNIIAVSRHTKDDLVKFLKIDPQKIVVRHIDVDPIYKKEISLEKSAEVLRRYKLISGYIYSGGGMDKRKNIDALIRAYKLLVDENKYIPDLVISGKLIPRLAPLIIDVGKLVRDLKLESKVKILDFVAQEDLPVIYKNAQVFVYPSLYEGFGLPVLEAMNVGTAVISSDNSSLGEVVGESALICDVNNPRDIADKIKQILADENLRMEKINQGREKAKYFSWEKFISQKLIYKSND